MALVPRVLKPLSRMIDLGFDGLDGLAHGLRPPDTERQSAIRVEQLDAVTSGRCLGVDHVGLERLVVRHEFEVVSSATVGLDGRERDGGYPGQVVRDEGDVVLDEMLSGACRDRIEGNPNASISEGSDLSLIHI